jgi:hypothetical protein
MNRPADIALRSLFALLLGSATSAALAAEVDYSLRAGGTWSDNFELLPSDQARSATAAVVGLTLDGRRPTGRLTYDLRADVQQYEYLNRDANGELAGRADMRGSYGFIPEVFSWDAGFAYDQARRDPARPLAPSNSDGQTTLTTGPTVRLRFGDAMETQVSAHYARLDTGGGAVDNDTLGGRLVVQRSSSPTSALGLGYSYSDVQYSGAAGADASDFHRQEIFARANLSGARTTIEFEAGYADVSGLLVSDGSALLRTRLSRRASPTLTAFLGYIREYPTSDPSTLFGGGLSSDASAIGNAPRVATSAEAGLRMERPRTGASLTYRYREEDGILVADGKRKFNELQGSFTRAFTPRSRGSLFAGVSQEDLSQVTSGIEERTFGAELSFDIGRALALQFRVQHSTRDAKASIDGYSETNGGIYVSYRGALGRPAPGPASR